jgi:hypothetical protein
MSNMVPDRIVVDTFNTSDQVAIDATITDDLSGFSSGSIKFTAPSGLNSTSSTFLPTVTPDVYRAAALFQPFIETGVWTLQITVVDHAGNVRLFDTTDLANAGFTSTVLVTGSQDTTPITVGLLEFVPQDENAFPVPIGGASFVVRGFVSDNLAGIAEVNLVYRSQTSSQVANFNANYGGDPNISEWRFYVHTPPYAAEGLWLPELVTLDNAGTQKTYSHAELVALGYDMSVNIGQNITENTTNGGSVTTDTGGTGATTTVPVQTTVQTPTAGDVSITRIDTADPNVEFGGYSFFAEQFNITAPLASTTAPLVLTFTVDQSKLGGLAAADVEVFRDGLVVADCLVATEANPDPCVVSRTTVAAGDVQIVVNTSHASVWSLGHQISTPTFQFEKWKKPFKSAPQLNESEGGEAIAVKFSMGGDFGLGILAQGFPMSQQIDCNTREVMGDATPTVSTNHNQGLTYGGGDNGFYKYKWKTMKKWKNTCRQFMLTFTTGETQVLMFRFEH